MIKGSRVCSLHLTQNRPQSPPSSPTRMAKITRSLAPANEVGSRRINNAPDWLRATSGVPWAGFRMGMPLTVARRWMLTEAQAAGIALIPCLWTRPNNFDNAEAQAAGRRSVLEIRLRAERTIPASQGKNRVRYCPCDPNVGSMHSLCGFLHPEAEQRISNAIPTWTQCRVSSLEY